MARNGANFGRRRKDKFQICHKPPLESLGKESVPDYFNPETEIK